VSGKFDAVCVKCKTLKQCRDSTLGPICQPCFLHVWRESKEPIVVPPDPGRRAFVLVERKRKPTYITIHGVLYAFETEGAAQHVLESVRKEMPDEVRNVRVEEVDARRPFEYALAHGVKMIGVRVDAV
jgi:hypothetical protein